MNWRIQLLTLLMALGLVASACGDATTSTDTASDDTSEAASDDGAAETENDTGEATTSTTAAPTTTASTVEETTTTVAAPANPAELTLLDQGAEPRTELRLRIPDGQTETMVMEQRQTLVQEILGETLQDVEITVITKQEILTTVIDGGFRVSSKIISAEAGPDVDPAMAAEVTKGMEASIGVTTEAEMDDLGNISTTAVGGTDGYNDEGEAVLQSLAQLSVPLPSEPVGIGASWEVAQSLNLAGIEPRQTTTYTLTAIEGTVITLEAMISQVVEPGSVIAQGGAEVEVASWTNDGTGTMELDLTAIVPTSTGTTNGFQELIIPGIDGVLEQTIDVVTNISPQ